MTDQDLKFQAIHDQLRPRIRAYLTRLVGQFDAEDLTQEVFLRASQSLKRFRGESQVATWVYRIATHAAIDKLRSVSSRRSRLESLAVVQAPERPADKQLVREEMNACIRGFVKQLPAGYRAVIFLSELEGLPNRQIARVLGVSVGTVKIRLHRARARLKKELERQCVFYRDERGEMACDLKSAYADPPRQG